MLQGSGYVELDRSSLPSAPHQPSLRALSRAGLRLRGFAHADRLHRVCAVCLPSAATGVALHPSTGPRRTLRRHPYWGTERYGLGYGTLGTLPYIGVRNDTA